MAAAASSSASSIAPSTGASIQKVTTMPAGPWQMRDPFIFCAYHLDKYPAGGENMGPDPSLLRGRQIGQDFAGKDGWNMYHGSDGIPGFPQHPHRGFETVTIVKKGLIDHSDSLGSSARFGNGDTQWVTAGGGIVHSEMFPLLNRESENPLQLFQLWLNLPAKSKMAPAHFTMFWNEKQPKTTFITPNSEAKTTVSVVAGSLGEVRALSPPPESWASQKEADVAIYLISIEPGAVWTLPPATSGSKAQRTLYFYEGDSVIVDGKSLIGGKGSISIELNPFESCTLSTPASALRRGELLLLQGAPIGEPVAQHGPFVMNTASELTKAFEDYRKTQFGGWPFKQDAPVHSREQKRFAKHADGRLEEPEGK